MKLLIMLLIPLGLGALLFYGFANKEGLTKEQKLKRFSLIVLGIIALVFVLNQFEII